MTDTINLYKELDLSIPPAPGRNLVEAGAGTGKTFSIALLFLWQVIYREMSVDQILVVTFTDAATSELKDRIRKFLNIALDVYAGNNDESDEIKCVSKICLYGDPDSDQIERRKIITARAIHNFDDVSIFTIHSFCQRILSDNAFETGSPFATSVIENQDEVVRQLSDDFYRSYTYKQSDLSFALLEECGVSLKFIYTLAKEYINHISLKITPGTTAELEKSVAISFAGENLEKLYHETGEQYKNKITGLDTAWQKEAENFFKDDRKFKKKYKIETIIEKLLLFFSNTETDYPLSDQFRDIISFFSRRTIIEKAFLKKFAEEPVQHPFFNFCEELDEICLRYENQKDEESTARKTALIHYMLKTIKTGLDSYKNERHLISYNDMLSNLDKAVNSNKDLIKTVSKRFSSVFIDEFQDTDPMQYNIFSTLFSNVNTYLYFIGDPKQAIYSFRGADLETYIEAAISCKECYSLTTNFRSTSDIIDPINRIFSNKNPFIEKSIAYREALSAKGKSSDFIIKDGRSNFIVSLIDNFNKSESEQHIADNIALRIKDILALSEKKSAMIGDKSDDGDKIRRPVMPADIAVLTRTGKQGSKVAAAIREQGINAIEINPVSVYSSEEFFEMELLAESLSDPYCMKKLSALLCTRICGLTVNDIDDIAHNDSEKYNGYLLDIRRYADLWKRYSFNTAVCAVFEDFYTYNRILSLSNGDRIITNYNQLIEIFNRYCLRNSAGPEELLFFIQMLKNEDIDDDDSEQPVRMESDEQAVIVSTIHKSKGLEYPIVFVPYCWNNSEPFANNNFVYHKNGERCLEIVGGNDCDNYKKCANEILAENIRLLYVSLTRACNRLYLYWGNVKNRSSNFYSSALDYLFFADMLDESEDDNSNDYVQKLRSLLRTDKPDLSDTLKEKFDGINIDVEHINNSEHDSDKLLSKTERITNFKSRVFDRAIDRSWKINSYSYITSGIYDESGHETHLPEQKRDENMLPPGASAGNCFHKIFENIDFKKDMEEQLVTIEDSLNRYGFDLSYKDYVLQCVSSVLKAEVMPGFKLSMLNSRDRVHEMEFYFVINNADITRLVKIINKEYPEFITNEKMIVSEINGFMKGFIDLTFVYKDKIFIADWKSNYLPGTYSESEVKDSMRRHLYHIQMIIYSVALWRYIKSRCGSFDYSMFGGVLYLYVRGMREDCSSGVYFDRPKEQFLIEVERCFV